MTDVPAGGNAPKEGPVGVSNTASQDGRPSPNESPATGDGPPSKPVNGHAELSKLPDAKGKSPGDGPGPSNPPSGEIRLGGGDLVAVTPPPPEGNLAPVPVDSEPTPPNADGQPARARVKGRIDIADEVVEKVAAAAAYEVEGVADLAGNVANALEMMRQRIGIGRKKEEGRVTADIAGGEAEIDVAITIKYGHAIVEVARRVQVNVAQQANLMLGLKVMAVNVTVDDIEMIDDALTYKDEDGSSDASGFSIET